MKKKHESIFYAIKVLKFKQKQTHFMFDSIIRVIVKALLWVRYSIEIKGLKKVRSEGCKSILFLSNHQALIDPIILLSTLHKDFKPRPVAFQAAVDIPIIKQIAYLLRAFLIPYLPQIGKRGYNIVVEKMENIIKSIKIGNNILIYPAGRLCSRFQEEIGGNSSVEKILRAIPDVRIVIIRIRGLWGSSFSQADGIPPQIRLKHHILSILANMIFLGPRRKVNIEFLAPEDFPKQADRLTINRYLETFYNQYALPNIYVPYKWWEGRNIKIFPEPYEKKVIYKNLISVPLEVQKQIMQFLSKLSGVININIDLRLSQDLGLDSLEMIELMIWIEKEFGIQLDDMNALQTVGDCFLALNGKIVGKKILESPRIVSNKWYKKSSRTTIDNNFLGCHTIAEAFLNQAIQRLDDIIIADQENSTKTYRQIITYIMALKPEVEKIPGNSVGIMLPTSINACIAYFTVMFSGKIPAIVNWRNGEKPLLSFLKQIDVTHVIVSKILLENLNINGQNYTNIGVNWIFWEELIQIISWKERVSSILKSNQSIKSLSKVEVPKTATIIFESGNEVNPNAVPLSHYNILTKGQDLLKILNFNTEDCLISILPLYNSIGFFCSIILPLCMGLKTVYYPILTDSTILANLIEAYKVSILIGIPIALYGIAHISSPKQLKSLRLIYNVDGKCSKNTRETFYTISPQAILYEGCSITECSSIVTINNEIEWHPNIVGRILPSLKYAIVHPITNKRVKKGILLLRGPSIFNGYIKVDEISSFKDFEGDRWYCTSEIVQENEPGNLTFLGSLKRCIRISGEMISLNAIEFALSHHFQKKNDEIMLVDAIISDDYSEIILITSLDIKRDEVNNLIFKEGLSGLHNIRRIIKVDRTLL